MDTELLKTFMELVQTRHFGKAANRLNVTQSAVSARVRLLEQEVGRPLFNRQRHNIQLTHYGEKLVRHAKEVLQAWDKACTTLSLEEEPRPSLQIGGVSSLWEKMLLPLVSHLHHTLPGMTFSVSVEPHDTLIREVLERRIDICFSYDALPMPSLVSRKMGEVELVMLCLSPDMGLDEALKLDYILVDWGKSPSVAYAQSMDLLPRPALRTNSAKLALNFFLENGGTLFLPRCFVSRLLEEKRVFIVQGSARYHYPVYVHFLSDGEHKETIEKMLLNMSFDKAHFPAIYEDFPVS